MSTIKLADIPCEVEDQHANYNELGSRITKVLKRINFPNRDKTVISFQNTMFGMSIMMHLEATDSETGGPINLQHSRQINSSMSDDDIAREIFILMSQTAIHEFMENFRIDGKIMFNPHLEGRNEVLFAAIAKAAAPVAPKTKENSNVIRFEIPFGDSYSYTFHYDTAVKPNAKPAFPDVDVEAFKKAAMTPFEKAKTKREENKKAFSKFGAKDWRDKKRAA